MQEWWQINSNNSEVENNKSRIFKVQSSNCELPNLTLQIPFIQSEALFRTMNLFVAFNLIRRNCSYSFFSCNES